MGTNAVEKAEMADSFLEKVADLEALQTMATYMRGELMRLESGGFWLVASLPKILEEEINAARDGRMLDGNIVRGQLS